MEQNKLRTLSQAYSPLYISILFTLNVVPFISLPSFHGTDHTRLMKLLAYGIAISLIFTFISLGITWLFKKYRALPIENLHRFFWLQLSALLVVFLLVSAIFIY